MGRRLLALLLLPAPAVLAHSGEPLAPHDLPSAWALDPGVVIPLLLAAWLYARGGRASRSKPSARSACFWAGWAILVLALVSPLHPLGEALFSAHMAQHELLMIAAAPLLVCSRPLVPFLWGMPLSMRRACGRWSHAHAIQVAWRGLTDPFMAWWLHAAALWAWHAPAAFQATLSSPLVHALQHASFLFSALLFWWSLFYAHGRQSYGAAVLYVFSTAVHTSILGALLTLSRSPWYPDYAATAPAWGLTALQDQQIGGLIMWIPAGVVYLIVGLGLFAAWLRESDAVLQRKQQYAK